MTNSTISGRPNAATPLTGTERVPMDQGTQTVDATTQDIANLAVAGLLASLRTTTISGRPNAAAPLTGNERIAMDQDGQTVDATAQQIASLAATSAGYIHTQSVPAETWTINHNLGFRPSVELLDSGGQEIDGAVSHPSVNQTVITLSPATAGLARLT